MHVLVCRLSEFIPQFTPPFFPLFSSASPLILPHFHPHILPFFPSTQWSIHFSTGPFTTTLPPVSITSVHYPPVPSLPPSIHPYTNTQPHAVTYFQYTESRIPLFLFSFASLYRSVHRMHFNLYFFSFLYLYISPPSPSQSNLLLFLTVNTPVLPPHMFLTIRTFNI